MGIGSHIRAARLAKGWSQARLCVEADVGIVTVTKIETGKVEQPKDDTLAKLCAALDIPFTPSVPARIGRVNGSDAIRIMDSFVESVRLMNLAREERELRAAAAKIGTVCGDCDKWMKSRQCPKDRNVNGFNRGPSMVHPVCESFSPRPDHDERIARLTCDANRIRDEIEKSAGGA